MYLLTVIPIARGIFKEELHYFTSKVVPLGSIVSVPVRSRNIPAFVTNSRHVSNTKLDIKSYPYKIKKIDSIKSDSFFLPEFIECVNDVALYYAGDVGQVISTLTPKEILTSIDKIAKPKIQKSTQPAKDGTLWQGAHDIQTSDDERLAHYKSKIREAFAQGKSVFLCLPTILDVEKMAVSFGKGIKEYTINIHGGLSKTKLRIAWTEILQTSHPVLIVATGHFLSIPRGDLGTIIIEKENSPAYKTLVRPFIDLRYAAKSLAKVMRINLIRGDLSLRAETIHESSKYGSDINYRILGGAPMEIVDMSVYKKSKPYRTLSDEVIDQIKKSSKSGEKSFIFVNRKGLSTFSICEDCGVVVMCKYCSAPLVLHSHSNNKSKYRCHKCGEQYSSFKRCGSCNSWHITALGTGIEKIINELKKSIVKVPLFKIDSENVSKSADGEQIYSAFLATQGGVLLGTEMAFYYVDKSVDNSIVATIDSFFAIPDFRIKERVLNILLRMKHAAKNKYIVQTRNAGAPIFSHIKSGNLLNFYREELAERERFNYPPFSVLIKVSREGDKKTITSDITKLEKKLSEYNPIIYDAFISKVKNKNRKHLLLKIQADKWPDKELIAKLKSLPPKYVTNVNPTEIL